MNNRRLIVIAINGICFLLFVGVLLTLTEFFSENFVDHWDFKLILFLTLVGIGFLLAIVSLFLNKVLSKHLWTSLLVIILFLSVKAFPLHLVDYQKVLIPISYAQLNKVSHLDLTQSDDEAIIYFYRSDCVGSTKFKHKLTKYLQKQHISINEFDLTTIRTKMSAQKYANLTKRLGVSAVPSLIYSYKGLSKSDKPYSVTFNGISDKKMFAKMTKYLIEDKGKTTGPGIVYKQK